MPLYVEIDIVLETLMIVPQFVLTPTNEGNENDISFGYSYENNN